MFWGERHALRGEWAGRERDPAATGRVMRAISNFNPDRKTDINSGMIIVGFLALSLLIEGTTKQMEWARTGFDAPGGLSAQWMYEATSHLALLLATAILPLWLDRFPLGPSNWKKRIPLYALAFGLFTIVHVLLMVGMRHGLWPLFDDGRYYFGLLELEPWAYESRKDVFTFLGFLGVFLTSRQLAALQRERRAALEDAKSSGHLTLKSGGRSLMIRADEFVNAKAAGNYVELHTLSGQHFVRLTLADLAGQLRQAGTEPVRLHRSHLTVRAQIREIGPGNVRLVTGTTLPIGRRYRADLINAVP